MFLHPVNVRCLVREYGSLEQSPEKISAMVVEIAGYSMSEDVRQRHRYLSHLPLTCEFSICELALQPPVVSKETLEIFSDDIEKRKRQRQKKAREERRREHRIEMEENKKQGKYPEVHIPLENLQQFPAFNSYTCSSDSALGPTSTEGHGAFSISPLSRIPGSQADFVLSPVSPTANQGSPPLCIGSLEEDSPFPLFAQMLRVGKAKADVWPKTIPKKDENSLVPPATMDSDGESDNSDRVPVPSFQNSFSQAIEAAFMKLDTPATSDALSEERGGKKRKEKSRSRNSCSAPPSSTPSDTTGPGYLLHLVFSPRFRFAAVIFMYLSLNRLVLGGGGFQNMRGNQDFKYSVFSSFPLYTKIKY
uniref:Ring finger protein 10 n=1 Tax=Pipistrellus kuhlii TaxID=59472 RepID=A0A7J7WLG1_PIPKU|nr:hypothetical protein mPipKuh1_007927 [Pipistrellus kuhlii]